MWKLYYGDWSTFSSEDGSLSEAPRRGLICAQWWKGEAKHTIVGGDFYSWDPVDEMLQPRDLMGALDVARETGLLKAVEPGLPTRFETTVGPMDLIGLLHYMIDENRTLFAGQMVSRSDYDRILEMARGPILNVSPPL